MWSRKFPKRVAGWAPSAAGIQDTDAVLKPLIEARNQRQNVAFSTGNTVCPLSSAMTLWKRSNRA